ncbi:uncharacterized protein [Chironomus tepperi]|uniref:uncharacterized protein n=1 Tax=Chironomus tepperi TaxID=113505 RepID=UPI00391F6EF3
MSKFIYYDKVNKVWNGKPHTPVYNPEANLGQLILQRLIQTPKNIFQVSDDNGVQLSNFEAYRRSIKFADYLTKAGLGQGDVVGTIASNHVNLAPLIFGCFTIGVAVNPLAVIMNEDDIGFMWNKTKPKIVFCDGNIAGMVKSALDKIGSDARIYTLDVKIDGFEFADDILNVKLDIEKFEFPNLPNTPSTTAFIMCSSGTTSAPKGVCKSHKQVISQLYPQYRSSLIKTDVLFNSSPSFWVTYIFFLTYCGLYGYKMIITSKRMTPELWMDIVDRHQVTFAFCPPPFGQALLKSPKLRKMESPKRITVAGTVFTEELIEKLKVLFPNGTIMANYASSESDSLAASADSGACGLSSGYPADGVSIKIVDENGNKLGPNSLGEIRYKCLVPFSGYFGDPDSYAAVFDSEGFAKTGDVGYFDDKGQIYIIDRIKHMLKVKGFQITPLEIEKVINEIEGIRMSCVVGVFDDKLFDDIVYAFVIKDKSKEELTEEFVVDYVNRKLIEVKRITGGVQFVDSIPMTPSGKPLYREVKKIAVEIHENKKNSK